MAAGDKFIVKTAALADAAYFTVQPSAGVEVVIHNVFVPAGSAISVTAYDGTNEVVWHSGPGPLLFHNIGITNSNYMRVQNNSGGSIPVVVQGVQTK